MTNNSKAVIKASDGTGAHGNGQLGQHDVKSDQRSTNHFHLFAIAGCVIVTCATIAALSLSAGCAGTTANAKASIPSDHFTSGSTSQIDTEHAHCADCHEELPEDFCVGNSSILTAHQKALASYLANDGALDEDQTNLVQDNLDEMQKLYGADVDVTDCSVCHDTTVDEDGNITAVDLDTITDCMDCHDYDDVKESTKNWDDNEKENPHDSHLGEIDCENCHKFHGEVDTLYCNECHTYSFPTDDNGDVIEGWDNPETRYRH